VSIFWTKIYLIRFYSIYSQHVASNFLKAMHVTSDTRGLLT